MNSLRLKGGHFCIHLRKQYFIISSRLQTLMNRGIEGRRKGREGQGNEEGECLAKRFLERFG